MSPPAFADVRIFDGSGTEPFAGEVRVKAGRIAQVARGGEGVSREGALVIDRNKLKALMKEGRLHKTPGGLQ